MKHLKKIIAVVLSVCMLIGCVGCSSTSSSDKKEGSKTTTKKRIIRIAHSQAETHPEHIGLLKFKKYVEEKLGDKYEVQIFPNELLGSQTKAIELTQTGAIDFEHQTLKTLRKYMRSSVCHTCSLQKKLIMQR